MKRYYIIFIMEKIMALERVFTLMQGVLMILGLMR